MHRLTTVLLVLSFSVFSFFSLSTQSQEERRMPEAEAKQLQNRIKQRVRELQAELQAQPPSETLSFEEAAGRFFCSCACGKILGNCLCELENAGKEQRGFLRALLDLGMQMKDIESVMASLYGSEMTIHSEEEHGETAESPDEVSPGGN